MKFKFLVLIISVILASSPGYARAKQKSAPCKPTSEQLAVKQACYIAGELGFDSKTTQRFIDSYTRYQQEIKKLGAPPKWGSKVPDEAEAAKIIKERLNNSEKLINIRKKYYNEYSKFLTQRQIWQVYQLENKVMKRFRSHSGSRGR